MLTLMLCLTARQTFGSARFPEKHPFFLLVNWTVPKAQLPEYFQGEDNPMRSERADYLGWYEWLGPDAVAKLHFTFPDVIPLNVWKHPTNDGRCFYITWNNPASAGISWVSTSEFSARVLPPKRSPEFDSYWCLYEQTGNNKPKLLYKRTRLGFDPGHSLSGWDYTHSTILMSLSKGDKHFKNVALGRLVPLLGKPEVGQLFQITATYQKVAGPSSPTGDAATTSMAGCIFSKYITPMLSWFKGKPPESPSPPGSPSQSSVMSATE